MAATLERRLELAAADLAELFHGWLGELVYLLDAEGLVFKTFDLDFDANASRLGATLGGERLDAGRHRPHGEVKSVTWCDYAVERRDDGIIVARVIFDL